MTWVAWRQHRAQLFVATGLVAVVAAVMVLQRFRAVAYLREHGLAGCRTVDGDRCTAAGMSAFAGEFGPYMQVLPFVLLGLPVLLGMFAGAPLIAREFEQGTNVFLMSQAVRRTRWLAVKLMVGGLPVVVAMLGLGLVGVWSLRPLNYVTHGRMVTPGFETQGLVVAAYTAVALALGTTVGILARNTVVAMAATVGLYVVLLGGVGALARDSLVTPEERRGAVAEGAAGGPDGTGGVVPDDARQVGFRYYAADGAEVAFDPSSCLDADRTFGACLSRQGITGIGATFHSDDRFWALQAGEAAVFAVISGALLVAGAWRLRRRPL